jgi:hypothetical protein
MTTSVLTYQSGELNGFDAQVLRDFALEAPWNWKNALEQLVDVAEKVEDAVDRAEDAEYRAEDAEYNLADAKTTMKATAGKIQNRIGELRKVFEQAAVTEEVFVSFEADMKDLLGELESP